MVYILYLLVTGLVKKFNSLAKGILVAFFGLLIYALFGRQLIAIGAAVIGFAFLCLFGVFVLGFIKGVHDMITEQPMAEPVKAE